MLSHNQPLEEANKWNGVGRGWGGLGQSVKNGLLAI